MRNKIKHFLRWLAVLPGAILSAALITFPIHWVLVLIKYFGTDETTSSGAVYNNPIAAIPTEPLEYLVYAFILPFIFVKVGAQIAPRFRLPVASFLSALLCIHFILIYVALEGYLALSGFRLYLTILLNLSGISAGLYSVYKTELNDKETIP